MSEKNRNGTERVAAVYRKAIVVHVIGNLAQEGVDLVDYLIHRIACPPPKDWPQASIKTTFEYKIDLRG
jgi:hypothetical protein